MFLQIQCAHYAHLYDHTAPIIWAHHAILDCKITTFLRITTFSGRFIFPSQEQFYQKHVKLYLINIAKLI